MNILFVSAWFPSPPVNGAKIRINNLLRYLAQEHEVCLVSFVNTLPWDQVETESQELRKLYRRVVAVPRPKLDHARVKVAYLSSLPRHLAASLSLPFRLAIEQEIARQHFDVVVASEVGGISQVSLETSKLCAYPKILDALEIGLYMDRIQTSQSPIKRFRHYLTWSKMKSFLARVVPSFDICTVPSPVELKYLKAILSGTSTRLEIVPHSLDLEFLCLNPGVAAEPDTLVYNGSLTYFPNRDAIVYLLNDILPRVRQAIPHVKLRILGDTGDFDVTSWQSTGGIEFCGLLRDVRPYLWGSWATLVPLRHGSGTRLKIIEAMALGTPVISTAKGAEGLAVAPDENIVIADDPAQFAAQTIRLLRDPAQRQRMAEAGRKLVEARYDWRAIGNQFNQLIYSLADRKA